MCLKLGSNLNESMLIHLAEGVLSVIRPHLVGGQLTLLGRAGDPHVRCRGPGSNPAPLCHPIISRPVFTLLSFCNEG